MSRKEVTKTNIKKSLQNPGVKNESSPIMTRWWSCHLNYPSAFEQWRHLQLLAEFHFTLQPTVGKQRHEGNILQNASIFGVEVFWYVGTIANEYILFLCLAGEDSRLIPFKIIAIVTTKKGTRYPFSSSCFWMVRNISLFFDPQDEFGPSICSSVVLCFFVRLVYIVVLDILSKCSYLPTRLHGVTTQTTKIWTIEGSLAT